MNASVVQDLLDHIVKKLMHVHQVPARTMVFVLISHKAMTETRINACVLTVNNLKKKKITKFAIENWNESKNSNNEIGKKLRISFSKLIIVDFFSTLYFFIL